MQTNDELAKLAATLSEAEQLEQLADHHWKRGLVCAKMAYSNAPWYHGHAQDTAKAANHFAVAAALRNHLTKETPRAET